MLDLFGVEGLQAADRQLAGTVSWKLIEEDQRPGKKNRIKALAQFGKKRLWLHFGSDNEGAQARNAILDGFFWQEEGGIDHPGNRRDLVVEVSQRGSLAGNIDLIRTSSVQIRNVGRQEFR